MIIGITGHRLSRMGGYSSSNPISLFVKNELNRIFLDKKPEKIITGMALGTDQLAAELCIDLKIPFVAAIPFKGQELYWPKESQSKYFELLEHAANTEIVSPGGYAAWKMHARNTWIVNHSDLLVAVFDGEPAGGTYNCKKYAEEKKKSIIVINPKEWKK